MSLICPHTLMDAVSDVLVVDDSRTMRSILSRQLLEMGLTVTEAENGADALRLIEGGTSAVRLVLTDWNMPGMDGLTLLQLVRRNPRLASVKVLMITTETESVNLVAALEAGANEYVMKPFSKDVLKSKLECLGILPRASEPQ